MAEDNRRTIVRDAGEDDGVILEVGQLFFLIRLKVAFPEVERSALRADIVEAAAVGVPQGPARAGLGIEQLGILLRFEVVHPDLAGPRTIVAFSPPRHTLASEEQALAVGREGAVGAIGIEEQLLGATLVGRDAEEAIAAPPEMISAGQSLLIGGRKRS